MWCVRDLGGNIGYFIWSRNYKVSFSAGNIGGNTGNYRHWMENEISRMGQVWVDSHGVDTL